jgi:hypothetical protein
MAVEGMATNSGAARAALAPQIRPSGLRFPARAPHPDHVVGGKQIKPRAFVIFFPAIYLMLASHLIALSGVLVDCPHC